MQFPGLVVLTGDFAQNPSLEHAVELQSEHWGHVSYTLYVAVAVFFLKGNQKPTYEAYHCMTDYKIHTARTVQLWHRRIWQRE